MLNEMHCVPKNILHIGARVRDKSFHVDLFSTHGVHLNIMKHPIENIEEIRKIIRNNFAFFDNCSLELRT